MAVGVLSVLYWTFFLLSLPLGFIGAVVVWLIGLPFDRDRNLIHMYACLWGTFYIYCCPVWRLKVTGRHKIPRGPAVIVANHESLVDILVLFGLYRPFKWVSKASNFRLPIIGWLMRMCGYVPVVRGDRASVGHMMELCRGWLARGIPVLIFPEGTRSKTGRIQPFKDGAFLLAMETGAPVIPIAMAGTGDTLPKHGLFLQARMDATVEVLDPLDPRDFVSVEELREATRAAISARLDRQKVA